MTSCFQSKVLCLTLKNIEGFRHGIFIGSWSTFAVLLLRAYGAFLVCLAVFDYKLFVFWENYLWDIFAVYDKGVFPWLSLVFASAGAWGYYLAGG